MSLMGIDLEKGGGGGEWVPGARGGGGGCRVCRNPGRRHTTMPPRLCHYVETSELYRSTEPCFGGLQKSRRPVSLLAPVTQSYLD